MEAPISASHGAMRSLPRKLDSLLQQQQPPPAQHLLRKGEKKKILLLKGDLQDLLDNYLMEPPDIEAPASTTAECWAKEVRELSYDIDDFADELLQHLCHAHGGSSAKKTINVIARFRGELSRRRWVADEVTRFRARVREGTLRHKRYDLGKCTSRRPKEDDEYSDEPGRLLSPQYGTMDDAVRRPLVGMDRYLETLAGWLADGEPKLKVASIVGPGGVGKTRLVTEIYRLNGRRFDCRAFVRTSRKPDMTAILTDMLSQLRRHRRESPPVSEVHRLIETIRAHLQDKKYFIIIEDLWASSTWDIISRGFPANNSRSRVLTTTEIENVDLACCGYSLNHIIKMDPLSDDVSRELFFSRIVGQGKEFSVQLSEVSYNIIRKCGGLPLAITTTAGHLKSRLDKMEQWNYIQKSLTSNLRTNPTLQGMRQVLNLSYYSLPHCLKACLLYLSIYREDHIIRKDNLVKQWMAEGFINPIENKGSEEVAGNYFDELVIRGLIQPVGINYKNEVVSCVVHHMVLNFIRSKSLEENFSIALDHSRTTVRHADKVRRLSLHFGNAQDATPITSLRLSQVRSIAFFGQVKCMPSIAEYSLLRVLILHFWADQEKTSFDLTNISELYQLRYLKVTGNVTAKLPEQMQGLQHLQTLEVDARATAVPLEIVHLQGLLHLRLVLLELLPDHSHRYIFPSLPRWIGKFEKLRILNIAVMQLSQEELDNLKGLCALTALSLHVRTSPAQRIVIANAGFMALKYFMLTCTSPCAAFVEGAMPSLQRLNLWFNAKDFNQYNSVEPGFEHLAALEEVTARIGDTDVDEDDIREADSALRTAIRKHPGTIIVDIRRVEWIFDADERESDEDSVTEADGRFCMLPGSSSRLRNTDALEKEDQIVEINLREDTNMQAGSSRQRGEDREMAGGVVTVCHTIEKFFDLMTQARESKKLVVIHFTASWCPPSRSIAPVFAEYAKEFAGAVFLKVDIDELESIADGYNVRDVVPTFVFVKDGHQIDKIEGAKSLRERIQRHTATPRYLR